jgi:UDP-glucose 4-epimerase
MIEWMLQDFAKAYGLHFVSLRYFNAAGADPDAEIGEDHDPETHLIPLILDAALGKRTHLEIYGTDYDTADGTCIRDYIHVTDLADAHLRALKHLFEDGQNDAFNLGNGRGFSVREVIEAAIEITGRKIPCRKSRRRAGDPPILIGSSVKIKQALGWQPVYSGLREIIKTAWQWQQQNPGMTERQ